MNNDFIAGCVIASIIVFVFTGLYLLNEFSETLEKKEYEVYFAVQEFRKEIYKLDDFYPSASFEDVFDEFEDKIEKIFE